MRPRRKGGKRLVCMGTSLERIVYNDRHVKAVHNNQEDHCVVGLRKDLSCVSIEMEFHLGVRTLFVEEVDVVLKIW